VPRDRLGFVLFFGNRILRQRLGDRSRGKHGTG
jgi:hypothetical protein